MKPETLSLTRSATGAATGVGVVAVADNDWLQILGIIVAALSALGPVLQSILAKRKGPPPTVPLILAGMILTLGFTSCGTLAPGGVYDGDELLFQVETTTTASYEMIHAFVTWEKANGPLLKKWPEINRSAVAMRKNSEAWFNSTYALRDAYIADPSKPNRTRLIRALDVLRTALNEAAAHMVRAANP